MRTRHFLAIAAACCLSHAPQAQTRFLDVTQRVGIDHFQRVPSLSCTFLGGNLCEAELISGGAAVADVDGDGYPDVIFTRIDGPCVLYRNLGNGRFIDATSSSGLDIDIQGNGAAFGDVDNDGDPDLFVTVIAQEFDLVNRHHLLFINDGTGGFTEETASRGLAVIGPDQINGWSATFGDYDRDGWIDLHVTQWFPSGTNRAKLWRNRGAAQPGHFEDVTALAGVDLTGVFSFASTLVDLDGDGWQDLAVAADFGTSQLFWNNGNGTFTNSESIGTGAGIGTDENGMGSTFGDFDRDGDLDWFVSSIWDPGEICQVASCNWGTTGNRLYRNEGGRTFSDATDIAGVRDGGWGWGSVFFDFDNDTDLDLVLTNGVRFPGPVVAPFVHDPVRLWKNDGQGKMTEASEAHGLKDTGSGKGLLTFDYDLDGDLDVLIVENSDRPRFFVNEGGNQNAWLRVRVIGTTSNRDGLGAQVRVWRKLSEAPQVREIGVASHFLGQSEWIAHCGLGTPGGAWNGTVERVEVSFPATGTVHTFNGVAPNQVLTVTE